MTMAHGGKLRPKFKPPNSLESHLVNESECGDSASVGARPRS